MTRGTRIVAIEGAEPTSSPETETVELRAEPEGSASDDWWENPAARPARSWAAILAATIALTLVAGWTAAFVLVNL
ncbi:MAG: hypothetical protein GXC70_12750, partial [Sphingomonadaceae bacterium]|nr:hypothetical protein [Sphingomonadaceae bacterium]